MWTNFFEKSKNNDSIQPQSSEIDLSELSQAIMTEQLKNKVTELENKVAELAIELKKKNEPKIEEYKDVNVTIIEAKDVSLHIFKTLPEFTGERNQYATWRTMTKTAIKLLDNHKETMRYFEALMIIRNKITGTASTILNNYNTAFNFEAIIDRLDFTYADKRPIYILEQELQVLQQNKLSLDEFYDKVNEKLNCIVNKINMTYKEKHTAMAFIEGANEKALRTFITGLNNRRGEILYASNPSSLPEAYARLQTIMNDQARITFANRFNQRDNEKEKSYEMRNPQFKFKETSQRPYQSNQNVRSSPKFTQPEPMEVDKSSIYANVGGSSNKTKGQFNPANKREFTKNSQGSSQPYAKYQRINKMENETNYAKTIVEDHQPEDISDDDFEENSSTVSCSKSSIFLGE